ncbi:UNVERIFIED_CONTAM: hypothetical protein Slati_2208100, partial [Sesamum latifolium]
KEEMHKESNRDSCPSMVPNSLSEETPSKEVGHTKNFFRGETSKQRHPDNQPPKVHLPHQRVKEKRNSPPYPTDSKVLRIWSRMTFCSSLRAPEKAHLLLRTVKQEEARWKHKIIVVARTHTKDDFNRFHRFT